MSVELTPQLRLDKDKVEANCRRMARRARDLGVRLRPHMKTAKSIDVARIATAGQFGGITVSTLAEARYFAGHGIRDITYAVGIVPAKVADVLAIDARVGVIGDSVAIVEKVASAARDHDRVLPFWIEIDCGAGRAGIDADDEELVPIARAIRDAGSLALAGVLTHAGHSYHCTKIAAIRQVAENERAKAVHAAERIRAERIDCPEVSVGSTPTMMHAKHLTGVTEMRPGVYMFGDLDQVRLGSCSHDDLALFVDATVIGHNRRAGYVLIDAGGLALSKDRGEIGEGYGRVMDHSDVIVADVNQEHGMLARTGGEPPPFGRMPVGSRVRVIPNHACMTAAAYPAYRLLDDEATVWPRVNGW